MSQQHFLIFIWKNKLQISIIDDISSLYWVCYFKWPTWGKMLRIGVSKDFPFCFWCSKNNWMVGRENHLNLWYSLTELSISQNNWNLFGNSFLGIEKSPNLNFHFWSWQHGNNLSCNRDTPQNRSNYQTIIKDKCFCIHRMH